MTSKELLNYDRQHVWHPYASMKKPIGVYEVVGARGTHLIFADGREVVDGMSSWWAVAYGYNNEHINSAVRAQLDKFAHVMFGGLTHEPAVRLAKRLVDMTPAPLEKIFFCDSGSVAVEVSMKMALQYWHSRGSQFSAKRKFATIRGGYHGDTWHAMSVCDPVNGMHSVFSGALPVHYFADIPKCAFDAAFDPSDFASMREILRRHSREIAAVILEPIVQGAGGMRFYHPQYLRLLREACDEFGVLLIFDEIATGFGRTGKPFACQWADTNPDIMCLGKALTGGYMSFAAVLATAEISDCISEGSVGLFMHGPTFMANPLACAAANAALDCFESFDVCARVREIEAVLKSNLLPLNALESVAQARCLGAIGVVETRNPVDVERVQKMLVERGVWLRPFGRLIYCMPPFVISDADLKLLCSAVCDVVKSL